MCSSDLGLGMPFNLQLPFLAILELLDVSKLTNDPIIHNPYRSEERRVGKECLHQLYLQTLGSRRVP